MSMLILGSYKTTKSAVLSLVFRGILQSLHAEKKLAGHWHTAPTVCTSLEFTLDLTVMML